MTDRLSPTHSTPPTRVEDLLNTTTEYDFSSLWGPAASGPVTADVLPTREPAAVSAGSHSGPSAAEADAVPVPKPFVQTSDEFINTDHYFTNWLREADGIETVYRGPNERNYTEFPVAKITCLNGKSVSTAILDAAAKSMLNSNFPKWKNSTVEALREALRTCLMRLGLQPNVRQRRLFSWKSSTELVFTEDSMDAVIEKRASDSQRLTEKRRAGRPVEGAPAGSRRVRRRHGSSPAEAGPAAAAEPASATEPAPAAEPAPAKEKRMYFTTDTVLWMFCWLQENGHCEIIFEGESVEEAGLRNIGAVKFPGGVYPAWNKFPYLHKMSRGETSIRNLEYLLRDVNLFPGNEKVVPRGMRDYWQNAVHLVRTSKTWHPRTESQAAFATAVAKKVMERPFETIRCRKPEITWDQIHGMLQEMQTKGIVLLTETEKLVSSYEVRQITRVEFQPPYNLSVFVTMTPWMEKFQERTGRFAVAKVVNSFANQHFDFNTEEKARGTATVLTLQQDYR